MGVFGQFVYGSGPLSDVYGSDVDLLRIEVISKTVIKVVPETPLVVNAALQDKDNYVLALVEGTGDIEVRRVIPPKDGSLITDYILLEVDNMTYGSTYSLTANNIISAVGQETVGTKQFVGRRTKTENMLKSLPRHFDSRPDSIIRNLITAIGLIDEEIGGSQSDPR